MDEDAVVGLLVLSVLVGIPLLLITLLVGVVIYVGFFFAWGAFVNLMVRLVAALLAKDNGRCTGILEARALLVPIFSSGWLVFPLPVVLLLCSYLRLPLENWSLLLVLSMVGLLVSFAGYYVANWLYDLPFLSELAIRAEEKILETRIRVRLRLWRQRLQMTWVALTRG